ncbi:uncharacterized protein LOC142537197 [Primulina tabacum]|uniref:uncharacterized protein LOC142537197 n=1 Tax=Primulina tabacum TaxID=48773 RepID=UPI003F594A68
MGAFPHTYHVDGEPCQTHIDWFVDARLNDNPGTTSGVSQQSNLIPRDESDGLTNVSFLRKPCWLPINSIYVVGSSSSNGLYLLDFYPDSASPCHVDYNCDDQSNDRTSGQHIQNRFLSLSEGITACASHPLNGILVAGTKHSSLLVISDSKVSHEQQLATRLVNNSGH